MLSRDPGAALQRKRTCRLFGREHSDLSARERKPKPQDIMENGLEQSQVERQGAKQEHTAVSEDEGFTCSDVIDGVRTYQLRSWRAFQSFLAAAAPEDDKDEFIWRGQRSSEWSIVSSLDRALERTRTLNPDKPELMERIAARHLDRFRFAARGRRGQFPLPIARDNDWWAIGQHYGLATPLLDWSRSPFAALYFAFEEPTPNSTTAQRAVYGLSQRGVNWMNQQINEASIETRHAPVLEIVDPLTDDNPRLVNQDGLFTRAPIGGSVERWVQSTFAGSTLPVLLRVLIPDMDRIGCLRSLRRMNVHHLSLFPDLTGATRFTNLRLETEEPRD